MIFKDLQGSLKTFQDIQDPLGSQRISETLQEFQGTQSFKIEKKIQKANNALLGCLKSLK